MSDLNVSTNQANSVSENKVVEEVPEYLRKGYRWVILGVFCLINFACLFCTMSFGGMATNIMEYYSISTSTFSFMTTIGFLTGFIFCLPFGSLADRFGAKNVMVGAFVVVVIGCAIRVVIADPSIAILSISQFLMGFSFCAVNSTVVKVMGAWFDPNQINLALGVYIGIASLGSALSMVSASIFPSLRAMLIGQLVLMAACLLACFLLKNRPEGAPEQEKDSFFRYLGQTLKYKEVWLAAIAYMFLYGGCTTGNAFIVAGMQDKSFSVLTSGLTGTSISIFCGIGNILIPAIISKMRSHRNTRKVLIVFGFLAAISFALAWYVPTGALTFVFFNLGFFSIGVCLAQTKALPAQIPRLPHDYLGTAGGFQACLQNLGAFVIPTYIVANIAGSNYGILFMIVAIVLALYAITCIIIPKEVGMH